MSKTKILVLGDGGWGTTLAILLNSNGYEVTLWGAFSDYAGFLDKKRVNKRFLPGVRIPKNIKITADLKEAVYDKDIYVIAVPSQFLRSSLRRFRS